LIEGNNGNAITQVPPGTGIIVLAGKQVEIFNNKILRNKTTGIAIASYQITGFPIKEQEGWSPFTYDISIHDNTYERTSSLPDMTKDLGKLIAAKNAHGIGKTQDIVYDGIFDDSQFKDINTNPMRICIKENMEGKYFTQYYLMDGDDNINAFSDIKPFTCEASITTELKHLLK
ncbi:MAG: hypothetical protein ACPG5P_07130, partial [Saprospiraceae bacterium]